MKPKRKFGFWRITVYLSLVLIILGLTQPRFILADNSGSANITNPAHGQLVDIGDFGVLLKLIIQVFLNFAGGIAVLFLVVGGFQYVGSRGNEETMEKAKKTITSALIGLVLIVMAYAIVAIVNNILTTPPKP